ncbi:MAG: hypothetical protein ABL999_06925 [Pyrinomonadaceae bacterium]
MKIKLSLITALFAFVAACSFSTASMSSFKTSKDKDGKTESTSFKAGETIYANAVIANAPGKTTTKIYINDDKGKVLPGSEVKVDLASSGTAAYNLPIPASFAGGKFTIVADMLDDKGEKKDSKNVAITIEAGAPPPPAATSSDDKDHDDEKGSEHKDDK